MNQKSSKQLCIRLILVLITVAAGCVSQPPAEPTLDRCLGLHTIGLPECSPPSSLPETPRAKNNSQAAQTPLSTGTIPNRVVTILVDDFKPQPYQGDSVYYYNRLEGDRGALNNSVVSWEEGAVDISISTGNGWGGIWMSLNHPIREGLSVNFSSILPLQIQSTYQSGIKGINISILDGTQGRVLRVELKDKNNTLQWSYEVTLNGEKQKVSVDIPPLQDISQLVLVLDRASPGDHVVVEKVSLVASTPVTDTATAGFVWSYGMLLNNWDPSTGLVRDKAKDASGEFDAIQATGSLAAATALAEQLGVVSHADAIAIVSKIGDTLLNKLPRNHGLWPHWVRTLPEGTFEIIPNTEWSSVDTVIAAIGLLEAQQSLGLETSKTEQMIREIEWDKLITEKGISHGYTYDDQLIPYAWDVFGGESWLMELAYASATGNITPLAYPSPPTANGSGFIDELAWLYIPPPTKPDYWGTDWAAYRAASAEKQILYYLKNGTQSCPTTSGLFGLSAAEVPVPARVAKENIYQAFGIGGQFAPVNDGFPTMGSPVIVPHYSAMIASLQPEAAIRMWIWLIDNGYFTPLNNVESLTFPTTSNCSTDVEWNQLKGSWNLTLQTLGWGRYLAEQDGKIPATWQATQTNQFLNKGYLLLAPGEPRKEPGSSLDLSATLNSKNITCEGGSEYTFGRLPGTYGYQITDNSGNIKYYSVDLLSEKFPIDYELALGWPPKDPSIPPWISSNMDSEMETITTHFGDFNALRLDTFIEYHIQTMNHSDPNGTVKRSEWFVCGIGLVRATMNHSGMYQARTFERQSDLELVSLNLLP